MDELGRARSSRRAREGEKAGRTRLLLREMVLPALWDRETEVTV